MTFCYRTPSPCKNSLGKKKQLNISTCAGKEKNKKKRTTTAEIQAEIVNYAACTHLHIIQDWTKIFWGFTKMLASHTDDLRGLSQVPARGTFADTSSQIPFPLFVNNSLQLEFTCRLSENR